VSGPLFAIGAVASAAYLWAFAGSRSGLAVALKPVPVLCLAVWVASSARGTAAWLVVAGLVVSLIADVVIERSFLAGLGLFLVAHLLYIGAFFARTTALRPALALPFVAWGVLVLWRLWPGLGPMRVAVVIYAIAICTMMWRAAALVGLPGGVTALVGAILFAASDTLIAMDRFHKPIGGVQYPIMVLYWGGQALIAASSR
jgi:uncharacterized membrane protein YhhN